MFYILNKNIEWYVDDSKLKLNNDKILSNSWNDNDKIVSITIQGLFVPKSIDRINVSIKYIQFLKITFFSFPNSH